MQDDNNKRIAALEAQVRGLLKWREEKTKQQLSYPLDHKSIRALDEAFREFKFTRFNVTDIYFTPTTSSPTERGQVRFFDDLTNQNLRIMTSKNPPDAADFTGTFDLTAV